MVDPSVSGSQSYDDTPYPGLPFRQTHPSVLSAIARLQSIPVVDPRQCRVLELGCCDGGNIIPMAIELPNSAFVGVDYSPVQIETGQRMVKRLGLKNIELRPLSILEITPEWGKFDYIITHGVFSWVPREVQEKILAISSENLSADGIAYISYNANPGWKIRGIARDLMRYRAMRFSDPKQRVDEARSILDFASQHGWGTFNTSYRGFLQAENQLIKVVADHVINHEHFEDNCEAFYFHEFMERAAKYHLEFLSDARPGPQTTFDLAPEAREKLSNISASQTEHEQYMDFLGNRTFRETMLHHAGKEAARPVDPKKLLGLFLASKARPENPAVDISPGVPVCFQLDNRSPVTTSSTMVKAALLMLANEYPGSIQFETLAQLVADLLAANSLKPDIPGHLPEAIGSPILGLVSHGIIEIESLPRSVTIRPGPRPVASALARLQAETQSVFGTFGHGAVVLKDAERSALKLLDGSRTSLDLAAKLQIPVRSVDELIRGFARNGLLIA